MFGSQHPDTLRSINNLALFYKSQGRYGEAEPLYQQALVESEQVLGLEHPYTLRSVNNLAGLYRFPRAFTEKPKPFVPASARGLLRKCWDRSTQIRLTYSLITSPRWLVSINRNEPSGCWNAWNLVC